MRLSLPRRLLQRTVPLVGTPSGSFAAATGASSALPLGGSNASPPPPVGDVPYSTSITQGLLHDGSSGVTSGFWNRHLDFMWKNLGGDWLDRDQVEQGTASYGSTSVNATGAEQTVTITGANMAALVARWLAGINRGILLRVTGGSVNFYSRQDAATAKHPRLTVVTNNGTFQCPCTADAYLPRSDTSSFGQATRMFCDADANAVLQFSLAGVTGTVTSATLTLTSSNQSGNSTVNAYEINCPLLWLGDNGTPQLGVADNTYWDSEIAAQPGVWYARTFNHGWELDHQNYTIAGDGSAGPPWVRDREVLYDGALRDWVLRGAYVTNDNGSSSFDWRWLEGTGSEPEEAYVRYYVKIDDDFLTTTEKSKFAGGWKCHKTGFFDSGDRSNGTNGYRAQPHIGRRTTDVANPYVEYLSMGTYLYHMDQEGNFGDDASTYNSYPNAADRAKNTRWGNGTTMPGFCMKRNTWYCIESRIKMNTASGGGLFDGVLEWWVNGVKVYSRTNLRWRSTTNLKVEKIWWNFYHGGVGPGTYPSVPMHWRIACPVYADRYIGPMRQEALPSWASSMAAGELKQVATTNTFASTNPNVYPDANYGGYGSAEFKEIFAYSGGAFAPQIGKWGSLIFHGGGHAAYWGNEVVKIDLETLTHGLAHGTSVLPSRNTSGNNVMNPTADPDPVFNNTFCEYGDGRPGSAHTYDALEIIPRWANGGTQGALVRAVSMAVHPRNARGTGWAHRFRFDTQDWERWSTNGAAQGDAGCTSAFDGSRKRIWWRDSPSSGGGNTLFYLNLATRAQVTLSLNTGVSFNEPDSMTLRYDPVRDILILIGSDGSGNAKIRYTSCANPTAGWLTPSLSQSIPVRGGWQLAMDYVPDVDKWVLLSAGSGDTATLVYDIVIPSSPSSQWTVTQRPFAVGLTTMQIRNPSNSNQNMYVSGKRWSYSPRLKCFVLKPHYSFSGIYAYRPVGVT